MRWLLAVIIWLGAVLFCYPQPDATLTEQWAESQRELGEVMEEFYGTVPVLEEGQ